MKTIVLIIVALLSLGATIYIDKSGLPTNTGLSPDSPVTWIRGHEIFTKRRAAGFVDTLISVRYERIADTLYSDADIVVLAPPSAGSDTIFVPVIQYIHDTTWVYGIDPAKTYKSFDSLATDIGMNGLIKNGAIIYSISAKNSAGKRTYRGVKPQ